MTFMGTQMSRIKVTVCCPTFNRPKLLQYVIDCFEKQTYCNKSMIILDDADQLIPREVNGWKIVSENKRYPTLGDKRNRLVELTPKNTDVIVMWDDDDLYLPWALEATVKALELASWSRCSQYCYKHPNGMLFPYKTHAREDMSDAGCQCAWGIYKDVFLRAGGYPSYSLGEDLLLARKLLEMGTGFADPIGLGYKPFYIWGPYTNRHVSSPLERYQDWEPEKYKNKVLVRPATPPDVNLFNPTYFPMVNQTPLSKDWLNDRVEV
jgi:glycosyltransferase involved in cell wall biosynthesis